MYTEEKMRTVSLYILLALLSDFHVLADNCDAESVAQIGIGLVTNQIPVVGGAVTRLLDGFWPDDCAINAIKAQIQTAIHAERDRFLRQKFHGFKNSLEHIRLFGTQDDLDSMQNFYIDLSNAELHFTENDLSTSIVYFRDFATIKITVMKILKKLAPEQDQVRYDEHLRTETRKLVEAGEKMIKEVPKTMSSSLWTSAQFRVKIKKHLAKTMEAWRTIYGARSDTYFIRDWSTVGLRFHDSAWLSCWVSGSTCRPRGCSGRNGNSECRGEMFWIVNDKGGFIKTCETVGIRYSYQGGKGYWLSNYKRTVDTKTCPGKKFSGIQSSSSGCRAEKWTIEAAGKECGQVVEHLDTISLKGHHTTRYLGRKSVYYFGHTSKYMFMQDRQMVGPIWNMRHNPPPSFIIFQWGSSNIYDL